MYLRIEEDLFPFVQELFRLYERFFRSYRVKESQGLDLYVSTYKTNVLDFFETLEGRLHMMFGFDRQKDLQRSVKAILFQMEVI